MSHWRTPRVLHWLYGGLGLVALLAGMSAAATPITEEEFVGPFPSWMNVKTQFGAKGDGVADDTQALQRALNALGQPGTTVIYLPAGTYRITRTLVLADRINVSIIGEDPATTTIKWAGVGPTEDGSTLFWLDGVAYSRMQRLTLDGSDTAYSAVWQAYDGDGGHFDTGNEYADMVFQNVHTGLDGGGLGYGFAETSVMRSKFLRNSEAGIIMRNFNALDLWVWHSVFEDCAKGITNHPGAGNWHVYNSLFKNSKVTDLEIGNTSLFSARHNTSINSRKFLHTLPTANPAPISLQGNLILDPIEPEIASVHTQGPLFLLDNTVRSRVGAAGPAVLMSRSDSDIIAVGNTFTVNNPVSVEAPNGIYFENATVSRNSLAGLGSPTLPGTPPSLHREVIEIPVGASAAVIQAAIDRAAKTGNRSVVHLPTGTYAIKATLTIPKGSDLQLVGDGYSTILQWAGSGTGPVIFIEGPTKATLRDLQIIAKGVKGIVADGMDQPNARIFMHQAEWRRSTQANLLVDGLDHAFVDGRNVGNLYVPSGVGVKVVGGPLAAASTPTAGRTSLFSGLSADNVQSYSVASGGTLLVRDFWYETGYSASAPPGFIDLTNTHGTLTLHNHRIALPTVQATPAIRINNFAGKASFLLSHLDDRIVVTGDTSKAKVLGLGMLGGTGVRTPYFLNTNPPSPDARLLNSRYFSTTNNVGSTQAPSIGAADWAYLAEMLAHTRREVPKLLAPLPSGVTDLRLFRVWVDQATIGIHLLPGHGAPTPQPPDLTPLPAPSNLRAQ